MRGWIMLCAAALLALSLNGWAGSASAQIVSVPHSVSGISLDVGSEIFEVDIDLTTLPNRPRVRVVATPDVGHADMLLDVEVIDCDPHQFFFCDPQICTWNFGDPCPFVWNSTGAPGSAEAVAELWQCNPVPDPGPPVDQCTIRVTATSFGTAGAPATFDLAIAGETVTVTGTLQSVVDLNPTLQQETYLPTRDVTIYENNSQSNGAGQFLLAGDYAPFPVGNFSERRALIAFDFLNPLPPANPIPIGGEIQSATLTMNVVDLSFHGTSVSIYPVDVSKSWNEGSKDPAGTEVTGDNADNFNDVTWFDWHFGFDAWDSTGGDFLTPASATPTISSLGPIAISTSALADDVAIMSNVLPGEPTMNEGWLITGPIAFSGFGADPFRFDSAQGTIPPTITVEFIPGLVSSGNVDFDEIVLFITDNDNFRWIYDDDGDDIVDTIDPMTQTVRGTCEVVNTTEPFSLPYTYAYSGDPAYVGYDCCTWRMDSPATGATGSGQALFYINLGLGSPPGDLDADGFLDPCDNCKYTPNGPLLGTCVQDNGVSNFDTCLSDLECNISIGEKCSMAQEDNDSDPSLGLACPEPGSSALLSVGLLGLSALARRRRAARPGR